MSELLNKLKTTYSSFPERETKRIKSLRKQIEAELEADLLYAAELGRAELEQKRPASISPVVKSFCFTHGLTLWMSEDGSEVIEYKIHGWAK